MKILIIGAGAIGTTYAKELAAAGHEITMFVRRHRLVSLTAQGIPVRCVDHRSGERVVTESVFHAEFVDTIPEKRVFDLIIVATPRTENAGVLSILASHPSAGPVLFLQNNWAGIDEIGRYLPAARYLLGFPSVVGGGRREGDVDVVLSPRGTTMLGEPDGASTERLKRYREVFRAAGLRPATTNRIIPWLMTQYVQNASGIGLFLKYGSPREVVSDAERLDELISLTREGLKVCAARGAHPVTMSPINRIYLPRIALIPRLKRIYSNDDEIAMLELHVESGRDELIAGYREILSEGERLGVSMPEWSARTEFVDRAVSEAAGLTL